MCLTSLDSLEPTLLDSVKKLKSKRPQGELFLVLPWPITNVYNSFIITFPSTSLTFCVHKVTVASSVHLLQSNLEKLLLNVCYIHSFLFFANLFYFNCFWSSNKMNTISILATVHFETIDCYCFKTVVTSDSKGFSPPEVFFFLTKGD